MIILHIKEKWEKCASFSASYMLLGFHLSIASPLLHDENCFSYKTRQSISDLARLLRRARFPFTNVLLQTVLSRYRSLGRASPAFMHAYAKHTSAATKMKDRMCTPRSMRCEPRSCLLGFLESSKSVVLSEILCSRILGSWQKNNIMR